MSLDSTGKGRKRRTLPWKAPLNAFQGSLRRYGRASGPPLQPAGDS